MAWDETAKKLAIKVIGTVESNLKYDAIYYVDPITVGIMQWYGTRAANLLVQMKATPAWATSGVAASLDTDLANEDKNNASFWTNRYLTKTEGSSLKKILTSATGITIQNSQTLADLEDYKKVAIKLGIDPEDNTQAFIFWACMYHQSPKYSKQVVNRAGDNPTMARLHSICLNHGWYSKFPTRYNRAKSMIEAGDVSGIPDGFEDGTPSEDVDGDEDPPNNDDADLENGLQPLKTNISHIMQVGDQLHIVTSTNVTFVCYKQGPNSWMPANSDSGSAPVVPDRPEPNPTTPPIPSPDNPTAPPTNATSIEQALVDFMVSRIKKYYYSQGSGRNNPDKSGVSDCSSTVRFAYRKVANIEVGTYTVDQQNYGRVVWQSTSKGQVPPQSVLRKGDLIFYRWSGSSGRVNHVEMYMGGDDVIGHGIKNTYGPIIRSLSRLSGNAAMTRVRRYL